MVVYLDGANLKDMKAYVNKVAGFTTNPTLMKQAGMTEYKSFARAAIAESCGKPISFEVFADTPVPMIKQATTIAGWGDNVYVKIPAKFTDGLPTSYVIHTLAREGVKLNVTAVMSLNQIRNLCRELTDTPAIFSIFAGRIADTGRDPVPFFTDATRVKHGNTKLLWASPREVLNVKQAQMAGADIITLTPDLIKKMSLFGKSLEEYSLETCKMFYEDAKDLVI